ncbi:hypothetical protein RJ55_02362 [Drechmeria coniospora]|nr:hypothetical protein RJ55_02362 [Drechmeria coniospora]
MTRKAPDGEERQTTPESARRSVKNRPCMRERSNALLKATANDPTGGDETHGRLLTTPTRLLKLILPIPFHPEPEHIEASSEGRKEWGDKAVEPLALLIHPNQPLSYLERLIQAEMPPMRVRGREKLPEIVFRAEGERKKGTERPIDDGRGGAHVAAHSGLGCQGPARRDTTWVRWSGSTEVGDFIRDAARRREFAVAIEGHPRALRVAVPSFEDRTHYMRLRLRTMSRQVEVMAGVKKECDELAHKGAHRLAEGGFVLLSSWWGVVYYVTFHTDMGWDLVEPVTYLAGLASIMGGYLWFLFISRDLSYKAAMKLTVTKRQKALYQERGFDPQRWEQATHEANLLRREIRTVATEYDVAWDEMKDLGGERIKDALERERKGRKGEEKEGEEKEGEEKEGEGKEGEGKEGEGKEGEEKEGGKEDERGGRQ